MFKYKMSIRAVSYTHLQIETGQTSAALGLPMAVPYAALVISFVMIVLVQAVTTFEMIVNMFKGKSIDMEVQK